MSARHCPKCGRFEHSIEGCVYCPKEPEPSIGHSESGRSLYSREEVAR